MPKLTSSSVSSAGAVFSPGLRRLVWLNIAIQVDFPLVSAFTPVMAGAGKQHFLQQTPPLLSQRTQIYTLGAGETAASVAQKFYLILDQLCELNQFRTFAHGLNGLQPGDDVDVPLITAKDDKTASATTGGAAAGGDDKLEQKVAGYASQAGGFLANNADKQDAGQRSQSVQYLRYTRASLVVIRGLLTLGWGMTFIAHGAFMRLTTILDSAEKQITCWQGWFMRRDAGSGTPHEK